MPCPYFEPTKPADETVFLNTRLPLIEEYQGRCRATMSACPSNSLCCHLGYPRGACDRFPAADRNRAARYSMVRCGPEQLEFLYIEEENHAPTFSRHLHCSIHREQLMEADLDIPIAAQALAFCRSYLRRLR